MARRFPECDKVFCADAENCLGPTLCMEENATQIQVDVPINSSIYEYPESFKLIYN